jgi:hypothetical protein
MSDKEQIMKYLEKAGVNTNVIKYIDKKYLFLSEIKDLLGDSFISGMNIDEQGCIEKLKNGTETFRITDDGNVWVRKEIHQQEHNQENAAGQTFYNGEIAKILMPQESTQYRYIENESDNIRDNELKISKHTKDDKDYYDGEIIETLYNSNLEKKEIQTARWSDSEDKNIPNKELETDRETINEWGFGTRTTEEKNFINDKWNFIMNGKKIGEKLQEEITETTAKSKITLDSVKKFFNNILSKDKDKEK